MERMRKNLALAMVALLALTLALAAVGCAQKKAEEVTPTPVENATDTTSMIQDTTTMAPDTTVQQ
jgi:ABC-type oligopeptide transport system substrate-binding subunit